MAKWHRTLNLLTEWSAAQRGEISPQEMSAIIADRLSKLEPFSDPIFDDARLEIADQFRDFSDEDDLEGFDCIMERLYDWADTQIGGVGFFDAIKACWVKTF